MPAVGRLVGREPALSRLPGRHCDSGLAGGWSMKAVMSRLACDPAAKVVGTPRRTALEGARG
jgi:hypothetical protein